MWMKWNSLELVIFLMFSHVAHLSSVKLNKPNIFFAEKGGLFVLHCHFQNNLIFNWWKGIV